MGWNPIKDIKDAFGKSKDLVEDAVNDIIRDVKNVGEHAIQETNKAGAHVGRTLDKKKDEINRDITKVRKDAEHTLKKVGKDVEKELKHVGEEIEKGLKKAFNAGVPDVLLKTALPTSISISGQVVGNGVSISYEESEEAVDQVMEMIRKGEFNVDIMYHVIPDSITIEVGVELALVVSVDVGASITYNSQEDIKLIVQWFKDNT